MAKRKSRKRKIIKEPPQVFPFLELPADIQWKISKLWSKETIQNVLACRPSLIHVVDVEHLRACKEKEVVIQSLTANYKRSEGPSYYLHPQFLDVLYLAGFEDVARTNRYAPENARMHISRMKVTFKSRSENGMPSELVAVLFALLPFPKYFDNHVSHVLPILGPWWGSNAEEIRAKVAHETRGWRRA